MRILRQFLTVTVACVGLSAVVATTPGLLAQEHKTYEDARHEKHEWNEREEKAYRAYLKEQHRKYASFEQMKEEERMKYWEWRHDHPDEKLHIR